MGALMRTIDWAETPLGPVDEWPQSLLTALSIILRSRFPMFVFWGQDLVQLYNDAYIPIPGDKHPASQGARAQETWSEIWDVLGPLVETVMERGEATWSEDQLLLMERHGFVEETYFTFSYSPVQDESGGVGGVFCACTETTARVLSDRRIRTVRALAERTRGARNPEEVAAVAGEVLETNRKDLPAAALYLIEPGTETATLTMALGVAPGSDAAPSSLSLNEADGRVWPIGAALATGEWQHVTELPFATDAIVTGPWGPPREGVVVPFGGTGDGIRGALVAALSPVQRFAADYRSFFVLLVESLSKAIAEARAREQEQRRLEALDRLNRAKSEFFSNVSHEFRTPLTLMLGPLEDAIAEGRPLSASDVAVVHRSASRLLKLVNSLLDFSRIEADRLQPTFRPTDLSRLTGELADVFRSAIESAGLRYEVSIEPLEEPVFVDAEAWEKIVLNLLSNALKFTTEGRISVRLSQADGAVELGVEDTGVGIPADDLAHLFERFYRVETMESRSHEGSGIGLSLAAELVELHGGDISAESRLGEGSLFRVRVPTGRDHLPDDRVIDMEARPVSPVSRQTYVHEAMGWQGPGRELEVDRDPEGRRDGTILVVDDNADVRDYLTRLLSPHYDVVRAADGEEALRCLDQHDVDLVLTDIMMPRLDGIGLLHAIREQPGRAGLPVVLLSARAGAEASADGLEAGADDYVIKPFTSNELLARVRANLETARLRTRLATERARADMFVGITHDLQTPLAIILATLGELAEGDLDPASQQVLVQTAVRRGRQLRRLIQQFLDDIRLDSGEHIELICQTVDLGALIQEVTTEIAPTGRVRAITEAPAVVEGDVRRLRQILVSLVENALSYTDGDVEIGLAVEDEVATITVADEGPPLSETDAQRIFERFARGSSSTGTTGTGLGLYLSRLLTELHGGRLELRSSTRGNRFEVTLPLAASY